MSSFPSASSSSESSRSLPISSLAPSSPGERLRLAPALLSSASVPASGADGALAGAPSSPAPGSCLGACGAREVPTWGDTPGVVVYGVSPCSRLAGPCAPSNSVTWVATSLASQERWSSSSTSRSMPMSSKSWRTLAMTSSIMWRKVSETTRLLIAATQPPTENYVPSRDSPEARVTTVCCAVCRCVVRHSKLIPNAHVAAEQ